MPHTYASLLIPILIHVHMHAWNCRGETVICYIIVIDNNFHQIQLSLCINYQSLINLSSVYNYQGWYMLYTLPCCTHKKNNIFNIYFLFLGDMDYKTAPGARAFSFYGTFCNKLSKAAAACVGIICKIFNCRNFPHYLLT